MSVSANACRILVVDDDDAFRSVLAAELSRRGFDVSSAGCGRKALEESALAEPEVILLDLRLPDIDGIEVLKRLRESESPATVILLTGHGTIDTAIQAIRLGAYDYLEKPCPIDKTLMAIRKATEHRRLTARERILQDGYSPPDVRPRMVGRSPAFERLVQAVLRIAPTDSTTLILGETGVGKEMVAKLLHAESPRRDAPFVVVDCTSLHEELLQSELFGHEKGAFTGAARQKHGLFEVANAGTLFLDEIGDASPEIQSQLLRVLETGRFRRVGGTREVVVDVRVVSATNHDLEQAIARGRFREDLYFRLSTLTLSVPPLRERRDDIPLLVEHFARLMGRRLGRKGRFDVEALELLRLHSWPGNVRELIHVVEQALVLADDDEIRIADLPPALRSTAPPPERGSLESAPCSLREMERRHVLSVLERVEGNRAQAAGILGISERNLYRMIGRYGGNAGKADAAPHESSGA